MTATCKVCDTRFTNVDRDDDGAPYLETTRCAHPGCEVYLCAAGCEHLSFACDGCGARVCESHGLHFAYERLCISCATDLLALEPECECRQADVDVFDATGCPYHDTRSTWNVRRRQITAAQEYEPMTKEIA